MSLDKAIAHGHEHRKPYYGAGKYDLTCRPHGGCPYCFANRMHSTLVRILKAEDTRIEYWESIASHKGVGGLRLL